MTDEADRFSEELDHILDGAEPSADAANRDPLLRLSLRLRETLRPEQPVPEFRARLKAELLEQGANNIRAFPTAAMVPVRSWRLVGRRAAAVLVAAAASLTLVVGYSRLHQETQRRPTSTIAFVNTATPTSTALPAVMTPVPAPFPTRAKNVRGPGTYGAPGSADTLPSPAAAWSATPVSSPALVSSPAPSSTAPVQIAYADSPTAIPHPPTAPPSATVLPSSPTTVLPAPTAIPSSTTAAVVATATSVPPIASPTLVQHAIPSPTGRATSTAVPLPSATFVLPTATPLATYTPQVPRPTITAQPSATVQPPSPTVVPPSLTPVPPSPTALSHVAKQVATASSDGVPTAQRTVTAQVAASATSRQPLATATQADATHSVVPTTTATSTQPAPYPSSTPTYGLSDTPIPAQPSATFAATLAGPTATQPIIVAAIPPSVTPTPQGPRAIPAARTAGGTPTPGATAPEQYPLPSRINAGPDSPLAQTQPLTPGVTLGFNMPFPDPGPLAVYVPAPSQLSPLALLQSFNLAPAPSDILMQQGSTIVAHVHVAGHVYTARLEITHYGYRLNVTLLTPAKRMPGMAASFNADANARAFLAAHGLTAPTMQLDARTVWKSGALSVTFGEHDPWYLTGARAIVVFDPTGVLQAVDIHWVDTSTAPLATEISPEAALAAVQSGEGFYSTTDARPAAGAMVKTEIVYVPVVGIQGNLYYEPLYEFTGNAASGAPFHIFVPALDRTYLR